MIGKVFYPPTLNTVADSISLDANLDPCTGDPKFWKLVRSREGLRDLFHCGQVASICTTWHWSKRRSNRRIAEEINLS